MDDPWGSPWADELQNAGIGKGEVVRPKTPNAPLSTLSVEKGDSPWDGVDNEDEDRFGEWSAVPAEETVLGKPLGFDGASDAWDVPHKVEDGGLVNGGLNGHSITWDESPAIEKECIPKLAPSLPLESRKIAELPSPDPWSTEPTWNDSARKEISVRSGSHDQETISEDTIVPAVPRHVPAENVVSSNADSVPETVHTLPEKEAKKHANHSLATGALETDEKVVADSNTHEVDHESSRPSTSPSDHSTHDEIQSESPRTSMDEEPKRPSMPTENASKVQELVQHFDELAKAEDADELGGVNEKDSQPEVKGEKSDDEVVVVGEKYSQEELNSDRAELQKVPEIVEEDEDEDDDFGDFEDGQSDAEGTEQDAVKEDSEASASNVGASKSTMPPKVSPPKPPPEKDFGRVQYDTNLSKMDKLFPSVQDETPERIFIPDIVPHDSFSSVEQRKTWYRISRYGTMRKYNSGDDENYVRANWAQSQIRTDTLKIVARWMEEDRMSGRVVLGGGSKGSSLFGWNDPNAPPVPLAAAFAARKAKKKSPATIPTEPEVPREWPKGLVRTPSNSKTRSPSKPRRTSSHSSKSSGESRPAPQAPVASFGWNSESNPRSVSQTPISLTSKSIPINIKSPSPHQQPRASTHAPVLPPIFSPTININSRTSSDLSGLDALLPVSKAPTLSTQPVAPAVSNDDDDWGEMMSSPVVTAPPAFPPPNGLRHKKSQSLVGGFSVPLRSSPITRQSPSPPPASGHRHTTSLDQIHLPKTENATNSRLDPMSSSAFRLVNQYNTLATHLPANAFPGTANNSLANQFNQPPPTTTSSGSATVDPWASADFSFFDTAPAPTPVPPPSKPVARPISKSSRTPSLSKAGPPKSVSFTTPPPTPPIRGNGKTKAEIEQDRIVSSIVKALPDLSYMLRR